jgi:hypothetical protein
MEIENEFEDNVQEQNVPNLTDILQTAGVPIDENEEVPMIFIPTVLSSNGEYSVLDFCDSVVTVNASLYQFAVQEFITILESNDPQFYLRKTSPKVSTHGNMAKENLQQIYDQTHEEIVELPEGGTWEMFCEAYAEVAPEFFSFSPNKAGVVHWIWSYADLVDMLFKGKYELAIRIPEETNSDAEEKKLFNPKIGIETTAMEVFMICLEKEKFLEQRERML